MIQALVWLTQLFVAASTVLIFFGVFLCSLAFVDYLFNTDLKAWLCSKIKPMSFMAKFRVRFMEAVDKLDTPSRKDMM